MSSSEIPLIKQLYKEVNDEYIYTNNLYKRYFNYKN